MMMNTTEMTGKISRWSEISVEYCWKITFIYSPR